MLSAAEDRGARRAAAVAAGLFFACVVVDLIASGPRRAFGYAASDAYYYLDVARHVVHEGRFAFDGVHATNGFHPLWQIALAPITFVVERLHGAPHVLLAVVILVDALMIAGALALLGVALARDKAVPPLAWPLVPLGAYGLAALPAWLHAFAARAPFADADPMHGTLWSYVNGMESALVLLAFAVAAWLFCARDPLGRRRDAALYGAALAALALARLDHALIALPCALVPLVAARDRSARRNALVTLALFAAPVAAYALVNWVAFGSPMPVSGGLKSTFPHPSHANLDRVWLCLTRPFAQSYYRMFRVEQQVVPMAASLAWLGYAIARRPATRTARLYCAVAAGVLLLGAYDLLFVDLALHGGWYTPVPVLFVSLAACYGLARVPALGRLARGRAAALAVAAAAALSLVAFVALHRHVSAGRSYAAFYFDVAPRVREFYGATPPRLLENDDGIVSFATGFPAMAGMGLALDPEGARAWVTGNIVPLAVARGFDRVTSMAYWNARGLGPDTPELDVQRFLLTHLGIPNPEELRYAVEYADGDFAILKLERR